LLRFPVKRKVAKGGLLNASARDGRGGFSVGQGQN